LACRFTKKENIVIKIRLGMFKSASAGKMNFLNRSGEITKEYDRLG
jgi:hypothetical protein